MALTGCQTGGGQEARLHFHFADMRTWMPKKSGDMSLSPSLNPPPHWGQREGTGLQNAGKRAWSLTTQSRL